MAMAEFLGRQLYEEGKSGPVDLIPLLRLMLIPIMSGFVGIDDMDNAQRSARLRQLIEHFNAGSSLLQYATTDRDALVRAALDAIDTYTTEFFESSRQRRARLVERVRAGELSESDLPRDVLTRQLLDTNALWDEPTAIRDSMILLTGGLHTTAVATAQVLDAYYGWRERSENDVDDIELMHAVVNETLRVFPIVEFVPRCAKEDTILNSGKEIAAGTHLVVNIFLANRDPAAFGADADTYRPGRYRELTTSVQHYGLAFGAGPHLCIGKPLVALGRADAQEMSVPRIIVKVVSWLLRAGIHPAPQQEPDQEQTYRRMLASYPVQVPQGAPAGASAIPRSD
ncbi:cytochrome P450 [[Mycobacterium] nativiensis]|uniref:Cytochrome P450 n=1 Tax=[Mycobacterium] nativiensis TaxID=2855503 RepID=A0ABU5XV63_9MYCO|nr:cytochrome P450 [Mycolicibacter sp. MYC340]MEB3031813.1 cytochrome P450 [Mycolicibacter sp. MYC340]